MTKFVIKHVIQPTHNTCVSACMAMILDKDIDIIVNEFHDKYWENSIENNEFDYLDKHGVAYELCTARDQGIYEGTINYLSVPSLNIVGGIHAIIVDARNGYVVYDPCKPPYKSYTLDENELSEDKIRLTSWFLLCRFAIDKLKNS